MTKNLNITHPCRGKLVLLVFAALTLLVSACAGAVQPAESTEPVAGGIETRAPEAENQPTEPTEAVKEASSGPLVVFEWSGYELPEFWQPFSDQHPDVEVEFSFYAEDAEALAKLQSGFDADVVHPCNSWIDQLVENNLIQPIDTSRLSNWPDILPSLAELGQYQGQQYLVPWEWGYESILVRTDKVQEIPDSWADLWDPQYAGHVTVFDSGESMWVTTARALGLDPYNTTPDQQAAIKQKMIELKPNLLNFWSDFTEVNQLVASGDVWLASHAWPDALVAMRDAGVPVEYITPKEGRMGYVCGFVITKNAKNVDLAYDYIDATLDPESMANLGNIYGYGGSNTKALPLIDPELVDLLDLDDPNIVEKTFFYLPISNEQRELFTSTWSEVKAAP